jgi:hypothetical protein
MDVSPNAKKCHTRPFLYSDIPPAGNIRKQPVIPGCQRANSKQETGKENANRGPQAAQGMSYGRHGQTFTCHTHRRVLPQRRLAETFDLLFPNQLITITAGFHADGELGEVFIGVGKTGNDIQSIARDAGVLLSLALQHGVPPETIRHAVTRCGSEEPASILGAVVDSITTKSFSGGV